MTCDCMTISTNKALSKHRKCNIFLIGYYNWINTTHKVQFHRWELVYIVVMKKKLNQLQSQTPTHFFPAVEILLLSVYPLPQFLSIYYTTISPAFTIRPSLSAQFKFEVNTTFCVITCRMRDLWLMVVLMVVVVMVEFEHLQIWVALLLL